MSVTVKREALLESTLVELGDALYSILNVESVAIEGAEMMCPELGVPYHFARVRAALAVLAYRFPELDEEAKA